MSVGRSLPFKQLASELANNKKQKKT
ncbi:unnamed protein product [Acanthoscelides obtectus]|uniref:Uncharacterized protein n=1 Tax=Acanthoscelides obtectus TaxID=200917 RepID=A0A9P0PCJ1_ACAOB|nr:unnamed protein product [Acanthoscelides obtectus]CAK1664476.1 hypothetical protein AOBTE_LOCUS24280 [Acanthoscelides obtectus]